MAQSPEEPAPAPENSRVTPADIGRHWKTSRAYASKCVKKGCPTTSLEEADKWRTEHAKYGVGYRSKGASAARQPAAETPVPPVAPAPVAARSEAGGRDLSSMEESLRSAIEVEQEAHRLVVEAQAAKNDNLISVRIAAYNKARAGRLDTEKMVQEIMEKRKVLIPMDSARELLRRAWLPLLTRLRSIGKRAGIKANPMDDVHAETVISGEIEEAIEESRKLYEA